MRHWYRMAFRRQPGYTFALALFALPAGAQVLGGAPTAEVLLTTQFQIPLTYQAALAKLDDYYQEQVGKKLAIAFPQIAPNQHYDVWHDMWVGFEPAGERTVVTIKRPSDSITSRLVKSWMLSFAGRLNAEIPIAYAERPPLHSADTDIYATAKDIASTVKGQPSMKPLSSWQHAGLIVGVSPMVSVVLDSAGLHGAHRLTVAAESAAAARQLLAKLTQGAQKPCVCAAYSEMVELDAEITKEAQTRIDTLGANTAGTIYAPAATLKHQEERVRAEPEWQKRISQAAGYYDIKYRIDKPYRQVTVTWTELQGYARDTGKFGAERQAGRSQVASPRMPAQSLAQLNARTKMEPLQPGAYRIRLEGETAAGQPFLIDERIYWFDGKTFEEL